ncbi:PRTRC system ThiF family protein [Vibrio sp.]|uniref:PRTRC system ThiF family protein n=1 Tax=Vibrio sp. TaxID=678 RepID=UPI003D13C059
MSSYRLPLRLIGQTLNVALIGVGGTGSAMAKELIQLDTCLRALDANSGLSVTLFDGRNVTEANIARQSFFPSQVGHNKAEATVWTANNLYGKNWRAEGHLESNAQLAGFDLIITALDRPSTRFEISRNATHRTQLWLDMGNDATSGQIVCGELTLADKLLPNICDLYDYSQLSDEDADMKSCSADESITRQQLGVNQFAARLGAQILWNLLRNGELEVHGAYFDCQSLHVDPIRVGEWQVFGYEPTSPEQVH